MSSETETCAVDNDAQMLTGILGGTFDPIHLGHLHIAIQVSTRLGLQQLQFMPCAQPVHRERPCASAAQRSRMIELAIEEQPEFVVNSLELQRGGPSYSVDSLREIRRQDGSRQNTQSLVLILGADAFNGFANWKSPGEILQLAHLVVCCRPGFEIDNAIFGDHRVEAACELSNSRAGGILALTVDAIDCSSSKVRAALEMGNTPRQYLTTKVADYIDEHHLYRKPCD
ncbi:nicotinate-nucleotide adenylyltransferase [Gammaproteobacteria bacterium]|nr:nicotinate-nucleotide adenylyltransferase [Gammaproteobacteria bacterium]